MFFDSLDQILRLAGQFGCTVFVIPNVSKIPIKNALNVYPGEIKSGIVIDQIKDVLSHVDTKQSTEQFIIIHEADKMNLNAANAFLKNLEEPKANYHFILQTENPSALLPTILSRAEVYVLKTPHPLEAPVAADDKIKALAKKLIVATPKDYIGIMNEITKVKDGTREYALNVLSVAIEISYKSYFKTKNQAFLAKLPKFIKAHENIMANGHIKLHLVADML